MSLRKLISSIVAIFASSAAATPSNPVPLEEQLERLGELGIRFSAGVGIEEALATWPRDELEAKPYDLLLFALGGTIEREPWTRLSADIWLFDTEAIEDTGDYVRIANEMVRLADGDLPITDILDEVNWEAETAFLQFTLDGETERIHVEFNDDWVDPKVVERLVEITESHGGDRSFFSASFGGQDVLIAYLSPADARELSELSGMRFQPL